jgi:hypothetical protein
LHFLFLFYSLSIAYIVASGSILQSITADLFGVEFLLLAQQDHSELHQVDLVVAGSLRVAVESGHLCSA